MLRGATDFWRAIYKGNLALLRQLTGLSTDLDDCFNQGKLKRFIVIYLNSYKDAPS